MKNIGYQLWSSDLAIGEDGNALVSTFLKSASILIEEEINNAGGICGEKLKIHYNHVPKGNEGISTIINSIHKKGDVLFTHGPYVAIRNQKFIQDIDLDSHLLFSMPGGEFHPNKFNISRESFEAKSMSIIRLLGDMSLKRQAIFIHDGKRTAEFENNIISNSAFNFRSINFSNFKNDQEIEKNLEPILDEMSDQHVIILDVGIRVFRKIFEFLNEINIHPIIINLFSTIEGRFEKINFPLIQLSKDFTFPYLSSEQFIRELDIPLNLTQRAIIDDAMWAIEFPYLLAYAAKESNVKFLNKEQFLRDVGKALNKIDGVRDIFIGKKLSFCFKNNINLIKTNYLYRFPQSLQESGNYPKIFYPRQFFPSENGVDEFCVNFVYIDVLRATNINIGDGTWGCEFYLDIVSPHDNPLEIIKFNNLSSINPKFEARLIGEEHVDEEEENSSRYYVVANFDFVPLADNYPFDWQHIYISFSITDQNKYGIIQPIPEALLDRDFFIDGWNLDEATTGVLRKKEVSHKGTNLITKVEIREEARIGWTLSRANSVTVMKIGIPLSFLLFLNYYTLFRGIEDIGDSIGILTTAFLSGIALYFSTERPQPLRMTTVDLIFLWYYMLTGTTIVVTSVSSFLGEKIFIAAITGLRFIVPLGVIGICVFLLRRVKSNRMKPRIN